MATTTGWGRRATGALVVLVSLVVASCSATGSGKQAIGASAGAAATTTPGGDAIADVAAETNAPGTPALVGPNAGGGAARSVAGTAGGAATNSAPAAPTGPLLVGAYGLGGGIGSGVVGASLGDPVKMSNAMAAWVNAHGGLGGRQIKLVQAVTDITSSTPVDQQDQSACAKFTEDNHVFAVISIVTTTAGFYDCLMKKNVFYVENSITHPDNAYYVSHPSTLFSSMPSQDRTALTQADGLNKVGYFKDSGAKYGIVYTDHPWYKSGAATFKRQAAKYGVNISAEGAICAPPCATQEQANEGQNTVLKFVQAGVDHVILPDYNSAAPFTRAAAASGYFPRLGMNSSQLPELAALNSPNPNTFRNAVGVGWMPATDVPENREPALNERMKLCRQIMDKAGQPFPDRLVLQQARFTCEGFWFLKEVLDRAKGNADIAVLRHTVDGLGDGVMPTLTWRTFFGPGRHDGTQTYRLFAYTLTCNCFLYTSDELPMTALPGQPR